MGNTPPLHTPLPTTTSPVSVCRAEVAMETSTRVDSEKITALEDGSAAVKVVGRKRARQQQYLHKEGTAKVCVRMKHR
jgi:hypothetical protein